MTHNLSQYLEPTAYCDHGHVEIMRLAAQLVNAGGSEAQVAARIFYWVRENVEYRLANWNWTAAGTLDRLAGCCTNKANLLVALCRAVGIPAAYYVVHVQGKNYMGPVITPVFRRRFGDRSVHVHAAVFVGNRWVQCDPTDEASLVRAIGHLSHSCVLVDFDGRHDAVLNILPKHINHIDGPVANIDRLFSKTTKHSRMHVVYDEYLQFLRRRGPDYCVLTLDAMESEFLNTLRSKHPEAHAEFTGERVPAVPQFETMTAASSVA